ncbi:MAG: phosphatidate cytidylyltransferase, partial [Bacillota bacterium]|nr:phosphatidate cytidylyltransferase [Bacillota bacterium]
MLTRIITAAIALPLFFLVFIVAPLWVVPFALGLISGMATFELLYSTHFMPNKKILALACVLSFCVPPWIYFFSPRSVVCGIFIFVCVLFICAIIDSKNITFEKISGAFFAAFVIPYFFSSVMKISMMQRGSFLLLLPFITAWMTDTSAFFLGTFFGKHKLAPVISPKKTVEGSVGGILGSVLSVLLYGFILNKIFYIIPNYLMLGILGLFASLAAQLGDLSMSAIKRN